MPFEDVADDKTLSTARMIPKSNTDQVAEKSVRWRFLWTRVKFISWVYIKMWSKHAVWAEIDGFGAF